MTVKGGNDTAVSDIISTLLLVGITVLLMTGGALVLFGFPTPDDPPRLELGIEATATTLRLIHQGGEIVPGANGRLQIVAGGAQQVVPLTAYNAQIGTNWELSEAVCVGGTVAGCPATFSGQKITEVLIIVDKYIISSWRGVVNVP